MYWEVGPWPSLDLFSQILLDEFVSRNLLPDFGVRVECSCNISVSSMKVEEHPSLVVEGGLDLVCSLVVLDLHRNSLHSKGSLSYGLVKRPSLRPYSISDEGQVWV